MDSLKKTTRAISEFLFGSPSKKKLPDIKKDVTLQMYFDKAYKEALAAHKLGAQPADDSDAKLHVPISIIAHADKGTTHTVVGVYQDEMHFSASLLKAAAMFAAFKLRAEAQALAATPPAGGFANQTAFFAALKQKFNSADAMPAITSAGPAVGLEPRYNEILAVTGFGGGSLTVKFAPSFYKSITEEKALQKAYEDIRVADNLGEDADGNPIENARSLAARAKMSHMYLMIVYSDNGSAAQCIRRLGYAYINVKLIDAKLFHRNTGKGIWVGGDFGGGVRVEVDSVNDDKAAVVTTTREMAQLFSQIQLGLLIDAPSSVDMKDLLREAQRTEPAWVSRDTRLFLVDAVKIGVANLKPNTPPKGPNVYSEGLIATWDTTGALPTDKLPKDRGLSGVFAVCWQNLRKDTIPTKFDGVAEVIQNSIRNFIDQTPIP